MRSEFGDEHVKIATREGPFERLRGSLIAVLESHQAPPERTEVREIARCDQLTLDDGEVDLDLVQPAGVDRRMNQNDIRPFGSEAIRRLRPTVGGAIVGDKEHTARGTIRLPAHDLRDKALEWRDACLAFATPEQPGTMHIPGGEIGQRANSRIFVLDTEWTPGSRSQGLMFAPSGLDAGLLVGGEYIITRPQCGAMPPALVEIENATGLASELPIAWEDPGTVSPGAQRILAEPAP